MNLFERYLTLWVALCIVVGIALGHLMPGVFAIVAGAEVAKVNMPVAILIWLMIIPMLLKIDFGALGEVKKHWRGVGVTLFINWAVKPFSMALLGTFFIGHVFASVLPAGQGPSYIAGLILLAAAPCTAMVFVWSNLVEGEPHYTLSQVALNDVLMVFLFAPLVGLLLGVASIAVPWATLLLSVVLYIVVPVVIAQVWRRALSHAGPGAFDRMMQRLAPASLAALLATLVLLFGFQGEQILAQPDQPADRRDVEGHAAVPAIRARAWSARQTRGNLRKGGRRGRPRALVTCMTCPTSTRIALLLPTPQRRGRRRRNTFHVFCYYTVRCVSARSTGCSQKN